MNLPGIFVGGPGGGTEPAAIKHEIETKGSGKFAPKKTLT